MTEPQTASSRFELDIVSLSLPRRIWGGLVAVVGAVLTLGAAAPSPPMKRCRIIDRSSGEVVATVQEKTGDSVDTMALIRSDLAEMSATEFERVWVAAARAD